MDSIRTLVSQCAAGTILAENVYSYHGISLVLKDCVLNQYIIDRLTDLGITYVWIYTADLSLSKEKIIGNINTNNYNNSNGKKEQVKTSHAEAVQVIKQVLGEISSGRKLDYFKITQLSKLVHGNISNSINIIESLINIKDKDEYTYTHCINVAFYAMLIAKWINLPKERVEEVIQAALLHDIGKVLIPDEILNKRGNLSVSEFDVIKNHSLLGYFYIKTSTEINESIKEAVLSHHERSDGSGYPYGLRDHEINIFAKIIAIADVYDAMTQDRVYKKGVNPFVAFEMFQTIGMGVFDVQVLNVFLSNISLYFTGLNVILENGERAEIVYIPPYEITKPVILKGETFIDIANTKILSIV